MNYAGQRLGRGAARHRDSDPHVEHAASPEPSAGAAASDHVHAPASFGALSPAPLLERAADLFRALGDTARLSLLEKLTHGEFCVGELADSSGEALSTVSQRLRRLRGDALVRRRRDGKHIYYTVADEHVAELIRTALDHALHEHEPTATSEDAGEEEDEG
jgi:DNA-binding transcriptional ArsR family regulator